MRVSQNEIYRLCQRALEGLGAPMGVDLDGALAVTWLEARNLPALDLLARDLARLEGNFEPSTAIALDGPQVMIDTGGLSAIAMCDAVVDAATVAAEAAVDGHSVVRLLRCRAPLFLLPPAARRSEGGLSFRLTWRSGGHDLACLIRTPRLVSIHAARGSRLGDLLTAREPAEVEILCAHRVPLPVADPPISPPTLDSDSLAQRLSVALTSGVEVAQEIWESIAKVAARVQVPASEASRARGAGGGDANV